MSETREHNEDLQSETDLESELIQHLPLLLNYEPRFLGFPILEFFLLLYFCLVFTNAFIPLGLVCLFALSVFGRIRRHKPADWFTYIPYSVLKISYPYLLPPGKRTFLP